LSSVYKDCRSSHGFRGKEESSSVHSNDGHSENDGLGKKVNPVMWQSLLAGLTLVGLITGSAEANAAANLIGPSFNCDNIHTPAAQIICLSSTLPKVDLELAQGFNALRQQVGRDGWLALFKEAVGFQNFVLKQCKIPAVEAPPPSDGREAECLEQAYQKQRAAWVSRLLPGPATDETNRPVEAHISLQRDLQKLGFLSADATIDGVYGGATRAAALRALCAGDIPVCSFFSAWP
jgi:hypothetical protein